MHCFIPFDLYNDARHKALVALMRAETRCTNVMSVVGKDEKGIHFYSWDIMEKGIPIYDEEEPITPVTISQGPENTVTIS